MNKRLILTSNDHICIVAQDKTLGDAQNFADSRSDEQTLSLIGAYGNSYNVETVANYMPDPSLEIGSKKIFTILDTNDKRYLGDIRIVRLEEKDAYELGIVIIKAEQNRGYGSQAIKLVADYVFSYLNGKKVYLRVYQNNPRAKELYLKLGFEYVKTEDDGYFVGQTKYLEDWLLLQAQA